MDGYALWAAKRSNPKDKAHEEKRAEMLVNALCEAAIVEAEEGSAEMKPYIGWMVNMDWLNTEYGFHANIEARAKRISQVGEPSV